MIPLEPLSVGKKKKKKQTMQYLLLNVYIIIYRFLYETVNKIFQVKVLPWLVSQRLRLA